MKAPLLESLIQRGSRYNDLMLAVMVVAIIGLMILPLPTFLVDALLATNLGVGVILLMMSMYIQSVLGFSTFPSVLLFTTLMRLSLNITTTRLILLYADAGQVVETFGEFVVAGNIVVGAVIFLIVTIVQFLVIAKGSERVAEVAARFTLDAMPGKQMSIDADLRAGVIEIEQAKARRAVLEKENQLYGAMDGAMKFVKGDAIAGLIIIAVNIIGGLVVGTTMHGMPMWEALQTYSILTIGDGLVSQIPALLISITAGVIVTRVSNEDSPALGGDIAQQVLAQPKALLIGGVMLFLFAFIPGFPKAQFMVLGGVVALIGFTMNKALARETAEPSSPLPAGVPASKKSKKRSAQSKVEEQEEFSMLLPLVVEIDAAVEKRLQSDVLNEQLLKVRKALYHDLGVPFPGIHLRYTTGMSDGEYRISLQEVPVAEGRIKPGHALVRDQEQNVELLGVAIQREDQFLPDIPSLWVSDADAAKLKEAGIHILEPAEILTHHLAFVLQRYAGEFLGIQETRFLLESMEKQYSELVKEVQRVLPLQKIADVFQRLVQEGISIRNLRVVMQALIDWGQKEKDPVLLGEYVRSSLKRYISYKYSGGQNILPVYLLEQNAEETIRTSIRQTSGGSFLALEPQVSKQLVQSIKDAVGDLSQMIRKPCLLTSMDVRRYVKKLIDMEMPTLPVVSYQELTEEISLQPLGKVDI